MITRYLEDVTVHPTYLMSANFELNRQTSEYAIPYRETETQDFSCWHNIRVSNIE